MSKNVTFDLAKEIIQFFLKNRVTNWPQEVKVAKQLLNLYPDGYFWRQINLGYKINSLAFFLTIKGKKELKNHYEIYKLSKDLQSLPLEKPKSILEILNNHV